MARHYSTRDFFWQMPNTLLARYFQGRRLFGDLDFAAMRESQPDKLFAAWLDLPDTQRNEMDAEKPMRPTIPMRSMTCWIRSARRCRSTCTTSRKWSLRRPPNTRRDPDAFIVCDKRSDINRVAVPISRLEQWQASGASIADLLAQLLDLRRPSGIDSDAERWEIGMLKGAKHASHLVLLGNGDVKLSLAGHSIALADVLELKGDRFSVDRRTLDRLVDQPVAGAGDAESAEQRRERLKVRVRAQKARGTRAFLKVVADEEGISVSRLKQLVKKEFEPTKARLRW